MKRRPHCAACKLTTSSKSNRSAAPVFHPTENCSRPADSRPGPPRRPAPTRPVTQLPRISETQVGAPNPLPRAPAPPPKRCEESPQQGEARLLRFRLRRRQSVGDAGVHRVGPPPGGGAPTPHRRPQPFSAAPESSTSSPSCRPLLFPETPSSRRSRRSRGAPQGRSPNSSASSSHSPC